MTRSAALAQCALRYLAQGESVDQAIAHAARRVAHTPADLSLARALVIAQAQARRSPTA